MNKPPNIDGGVIYKGYTKACPVCGYGAGHPKVMYDALFRDEIVKVCSHCKVCSATHLEMRREALEYRQKKRKENSILNRILQFFQRKG